MANVDNVAFGKTLKKYRNQHKLKQVELCLELGITKNYLSELERGVGNPSLDMFIRICNYFNVSADTFLSSMLNVGYKMESSIISEKLEHLNPDKRNSVIKILNSIVTELFED